MQNRSSGSISKLMMAAGAVMILSSLWLGTEMLYGAYRLVDGAASWLPVRAEVVSCGIGTGLAGANFHIDYRYEFGGRRYGSTRYDFFRSRTAGKTAASRYPAGKEVICYVNPASPADAVIDRGLPGYFFGVAAVAAGLLTLGAVLLAAGVSERWKRKKSDE